MESVARAGSKRCRAPDLTSFVNRDGASVSVPIVRDNSKMGKISVNVTPLLFFSGAKRTRCL